MSLANAFRGQHQPQPIPVSDQRALSPATHHLREWDEYLIGVPQADRVLFGSSEAEYLTAGLFRLHFENQLGLATIQAFTADKLLGDPLQVEVISPKFPTLADHLDFYRRLLDDLFARAARLPFTISSDTSRSVTEALRPPTPLFTLHFLCQHAPTLRDALAVILAAPYRQLRDNPDLVSLAEVTDADADVLLATFYTALQTKGFVILSGISGTGKTRLAQAFAGMLPQPTKETNHLFMPVRPDWRDSKSLLGYYNPLTGAYEWTPFLRFLLRAEQNYKSADKLAWFVILDEMNLAHVEYYFADLLSVLESGRDEDGWTREPLCLGFPDEADGDLPPRELKLPPNLYIVGTVNVDETTHAFSAKVLDRAFTLELTDTDLSTYLSATAPGQAGLSDEDRQAILRSFARNGAFACIDKPAIAAHLSAHPQVRHRLQTLNALLRPHDLHFGYRVFDEIVAFLAAAESNKRNSAKLAFVTLRPCTAICQIAASIQRRVSLRARDSSLVSRRCVRSATKRSREA